MKKSKAAKILQEEFKFFRSSETKVLTNYEAHRIIDTLTLLGMLPPPKNFKKLNVDILINHTWTKE